MAFQTPPPSPWPFDMPSSNHTEARPPAERAPEADAPALTRRHLLGSTFGGVAALGLGAQAAAQSAGPAGPAGAAALTGPLQKRDALVTLVQRTSQGYTTELHQEARTRGFEGYLEWQLAPQAIDDSAVDALLTSYATLTMTSKEILDAYGPPLQDPTPIIELRDSTILRAIFSKRQLFETMVEFWTDHFNVYLPDGPIPYVKAAEDRDVIRAHALGKFKDLLLADAKSAAMLYYLNNNTNIASAPNENYSREVMELHTLGVDGPYHEQDVRELARCFTGWTFFPPQSPNFGNFLFRAVDHDSGQKFLLGQTIPAGGGVSDGETMLDFLASHPSTADFVCRKLTRFLLAYEPPQAIVDEVAAVYLASDGDIKEVIRAILTRAHLSAAGAWQVPKLKRPRRFIVGLMRATGALSQPGSLLRVTGTIGAMGQPTMLWETPDGFPDDLESWGSNVLPRWEFASKLASNSVPGVQFPPAMLVNLLGGAPASETARAMSRVLSGGTMLPDEVARVQAYVDAAPNLTLQVLREAFALAASSPSYQYF